ncbi:hypothetical protein MESS2_1000016 [Mesorhizobium metallidurans STM 2683]|uniref:Uncharacterized protein n=1 Tax=Mesorhizobium metallidurans STM 2683 TaxID=1297569 RepID=M5EF94_9HYPH|nr:hypothetical protein MESS2_1000016 [Mesorhizobium metallidurans STM 2683]
MVKAISRRALLKMWLASASPSQPNHTRFVDLRWLIPAHSRPWRIFIDIRSNGLRRVWVECRLSAFECPKNVHIFRTSMALANLLPTIQVAAELDVVIKCLVAQNALMDVERLRHNHPLLSKFVNRYARHDGLGDLT